MRALRRFLLLPSLRGGAAAALLVCLVGVAVTPRLHAQTVNVCRPNPSPANPSDPSMIVATPIAWARVTSPLTVTGQARVFEAVVSAALYDREGRLLEERHFMAAAGAPELAPFMGQISFSVREVTPACLWVYEASARDGSPRNVVQAPLTLLPPDDYVESALDLSSPCIPAEGQYPCDATRSALWQGEATAWAARGVSDADARFNETVVFRVQAGDPGTISNIAKLLRWPYVKVTRLHYAAGREVLEVSNLGGAAQDLTGWTVRAPERSTTPPLEVRLPAEVLTPGRSCYVLTGRPGATAGYECRVFVGTPETPPVVPDDGLWPDAGGPVTVVANPIGLVADATGYSANVAGQPPPPALQGLVRRLGLGASSGAFETTLSTQQSVVAEGSTVQLRLTWRNQSAGAQTVRFPSGQDFNVIVKRLDGTEVWNWAAGRVFTQSERLATLAPGEERVFSVTWTAAGGPGIYEATAYVASSGRIDSNTVRILVR